MATRPIDRRTFLSTGATVCGLCVREKKLECCIECDELTTCDRDLWRRFPKFKEQVVEMQKRFRRQA